MENNTVTRPDYGGDVVALTCRSATVEPVRSRTRVDAAPAGQRSIVLRGGDASARVRPWWNDPAVAQLTFTEHGTVPSSTWVSTWLSELRACGFAAVRTGAVTETGADMLQRQGFESLQTLRLLDLALIGWRPPPAQLPPRPTRRERPDSKAPIARTRRLRAGERSDAAVVDRAAFGDRWAIDAAGIAETCAATPSHRARAMVDCGHLVGYAVSGRADRTGYLQRLAVHPVHQGQGFGFGLTRDSLVWMQRHRLTRAIVNTHSDNLVALALYGRMGFRLLPQRLAVLTRTLADL